MYNDIASMQTLPFCVYQNKQQIQSLMNGKGVTYGGFALIFCRNAYF
jgi:hypothetical protein